MSFDSSPAEQLPIPWDGKAEAAVLGAFLFSPGRVGDLIANKLDAEDFYSERHRVIFAQLVAISNQQGDIDTLTVASGLEASGKLSKAGGSAYLNELVINVPTTAHVESHIRIVKQKAQLRNAMNVAREILFESTQPVEDVDSFVDAFAKRANEVASQSSSSKIVPIREAIEEVLNRVEALSKKDQKGITGVPMGFRDLEKKTGGFQGGDLIILAARPGMGKTAFALNLLYNAAQDPRRRTPGVFFSLEMSAAQLAQRVWSSTSRVPLTNLRQGDVSLAQWNSLYKSIEEIRDAPIFVDETSGITVQELMRKCRQLKHEFGIGLVIIDYLQLMNSAGGGKNTNREQIISEISRNLKGLARELNVPVIALSQLNRGVESRDDKRPMLSDLRESGAIEQDADIIMFLYREAYYQALAARKATKQKKDEEPAPPAVEIDPNEPGVTEVILAKHRSGSTGKVEVMFHPPLVLFSNIAKEGEPDPSMAPRSDASTNMGPTGYKSPPPMPDSTLPPNSAPNAPALNPPMPSPELKRVGAQDGQPPMPTAPPNSEPPMPSAPRSSEPPMPSVPPMPTLEPKFEAADYPDDGEDDVPF
jgi:replicative DNA helicase